MENKIKLYKTKMNCCGCGACYTVCPKHAIYMTEDKYGFMYPKISHKKCIKCGLCMRVCGFQAIGKKKAKLDSYAMISKEKKLYNNSASGGAFSVMAQEVLDKQGYVAGCSMESSHGQLAAQHVIVHDKNELYRLQGSKYVQSNMGKIYSQIKELLDAGQFVLFSGVPCQVSSLKRYLDKEYSNLILVDLVCHGVPSQKMFKDYLHEVEKKYGMKIQKIVFRDKSKGWSLNGYIAGEKIRSGKKKKVIFNNRESSYYYLFQKGLNYRESCYVCPFAGKFRPGDITLGDYWGIEREHMELFSDSNTSWKKGEAISCVIINTLKGRNFFETCQNNMNLHRSTYEKISRNNSQLMAPTSYDDFLRGKIMEEYCHHGYAGVEEWFRKEMGFKLVKIKMKDRVPDKIKKLVHRAIK